MTNIKKNFIYNSVYQMLVMLIPLITTPYISRVLGPGQTGRFSYSYSIAAYFVMFSLLGTNNYGNRSIAQVRDNKENLSKTFWSIYLFQLICSIIVLICYTIYALFIAEDIKIALILIIYVISSCFDINWLFFGMEQFKVTVVRNIMIKILTVLGIFIFVKTRDDVYKYTIIYAGGMILSQIYLWILLPKYVKRVKLTLNDILVHVKPNLILFIPVISISLYKVMDKIMLGSMTFKTEVGYYEASEKVINIPLALVNSLGTVMLPRMSNLYSKNNNSKGNIYMKKSILLAMFLSSSLCFGIMAVAKEFVPLFYGEEFIKCITIYQFLLPSCIFLAFANVIRTQYLIPKQKDRVLIISVITGAIVNMIINIILIPKLYSIGAAIGTLCAEAAVCFVQCLYVRKELPIKEYILNTLPFVISGITMYAFIFNISFEFLPIVSLVIKIVIGVILYFLILAVTLIMIQYIKKVKKVNRRKNFS